MSSTAQDAHEDFLRAARAGQWEEAFEHAQWAAMLTGDMTARTVSDLVYASLRLNEGLRAYGYLVDAYRSKGCHVVSLVGAFMSMLVMELDEKEGRHV